MYFVRSLFGILVILHLFFALPREDLSKSNGALSGISRLVSMQRTSRHSVKDVHMPICNHTQSTGLKAVCLSDL